ncbi:MAG TPA: 4a-hydroxytetrahydrobiopterin dehydratase [Jiangellales bacterium]|nr:4a-hydroxytetrahydrobiopterin dehydratase [Jiangellales bacterium]
MPELLEPADVEAGLAGLRGWAGDTSGIHRSVTAPDFLTGIRLVSDVAAAAEAMNHHPDIDIRWRTVTFALSTHSAGGVTALDLELAGQIDQLAEGHGAE